MRTFKLEDGMTINFHASESFDKKWNREMEFSKQRREEEAIDASINKLIEEGSLIFKDGEYFLNISRDHTEKILLEMLKNVPNECG